MGTNANLLLPTWLESLRNPATYPHPVSNIQIVETHISWVALTGDWAYKLKKPVNYGFVDFSNLDLRRDACHEELRLNRRTSPNLYVDIVALTADSDGPRFGGTGPVLEYAVRIRQFAQEEMLDQLAARGELTNEIIDSLARVVADFHHHAAVASVDSSFGTPETIRTSVKECLKHLMNETEGELAVSLGRVDEWTRTEWTRLQSTFVERREHGRIRECHGDLHLGNLVLYLGQPTLFDCLEFNAALRWIDVFCDMAFLIMDLHDHGVPGLGWRALNEWLAQTGDYSGLPILRYYFVYRALVRAKVAFLRLQQSGLSPADMHQLHQSRNQYVRLALKGAQPGPRAMILMHGVSGSGKSFVARRLASAIGAVHIRSDVERKRLSGCWPQPEQPRSNPPEIYSAQATQQTYTRMKLLSQQIVEAGYCVIVDATFLRYSDRLSFVSLAEELSIPMIVVSCVAPTSVLQERITQRRQSGIDPSDADAEILKQQLGSSDPLDGKELQSTVIHDTSTVDWESFVEQIQMLLPDIGTLDD